MITEKSMEKSIAKFKQKKILPFSKNGNVKDYLKYFDDIFIQCFEDKTFSFLYQNTPLFKSYYRIRKMDEIKDFSSIIEYSYPNASICNDLKRANLPGYPVFYCSLNPLTAIKEMNKLFGNDKHFVVSKWCKQKIEYELKLSPVFPEKPQYETNSFLHRTVSDWIIGDEEEKKALIKFLSFIGDELMNDEDYSISACLSHKLLYQGNVDVLSYPSNIDFKGINFAFSPKIIDEGVLVLNRLYFVDMDESKKLTLTKVALFQDEQIKWFEEDAILQSEEIYSTFCNDFGYKLL